MKGTHLCAHCENAEAPEGHILCEDCNRKAQTPEAFEEAKKLQETYADPWHEANQDGTELKLLGKTVTWVNGMAKIIGSGHPLGSIMHSALCDAARMGLVMGYALAVQGVIETKIPSAFERAFGKES